MLMHNLGERRRTSVVRSRDQGKPFELLGQADNATRVDENMIVERRDGSIWMLMRSAGGIAHSHSTDGGRTWSAEAKYLGRDLVPGNARFFIRRLRSGALLMVRHDGRKTTTRSHLTAFVSDDDGKSWQGGLPLDERDSAAYPDGVEAADGTIYLVYDYDRGGEGALILATFTEKDVRAGRPVTDKVRLRGGINRLR